LRCNKDVIAVWDDSRMLFQPIFKRLGSPARLAIVIALCVVALGSLRFINLGEKIVWHDESYSFLRTFGHTGTEYVTALFDGKIHSVAELQSYQRADPELGLGATLTALASRPEHSPLYYLLARVWAEGFEDPVVALRSLSALFGVLLLPSVYWLARELFDDPPVSWSAMTLAAASPLYLLYAQEARQYALWMMLTVLSSAALLHALRTGSRRAMLLYALTIALGLYAHIMHVFTAIAHMVYLAMMHGEYERVRVKACAIARVKACAIALACGLLAFTPWLALFLYSITDVVEVTSWMRTSVSTLELMQSWLTSINQLLFDFPGSDYLIPLSAALAIIALCVIQRSTPTKVWLLLVLMLFITAGAVILPDLLSGGRRSLITRYLLPPLLLLGICIAYLIGTGSSLHTHRGRAMGLLGALLIGGGIYSQLMILSSTTWWNKAFSG
ncbi:MAG: hypothetical protein FD130_2518, partial [Halothiobacillaceae bacterium]